MKKSDASAKVTSALDLEFPDWSGMDRFTPRLSPKAVLRMNEKLRGSKNANKQAAEREHKCEVEFAL